MDSSIDEHDTGTLAQWEAFFRACKIPRERSQSHAAKFVDVFARPHKLSTYTKDDYEELGVKFGDRKAVEEYLKKTNGNPPEFADYKPTVRTPSAVDDDIIWEPSLKAAAQSRKPDISKRRGLSASSARRSFLPDSATSTPTSVTSNARASSTCSEPLLCKQEDNIAFEASAERVSLIRPPAASRIPTDRHLYIEPMTPPPLTESTAVRMFVVAAPAQETPLTAAAVGTMVASVCKEASPSGGLASVVERQPSRSRSMDAKMDDSSEEDEKHENLIIEDPTADEDKPCDDALEVEVLVPVSELPFFASEGADNGDEKHPDTYTEESSSKCEISVGSVENTDLYFEGIRRLPETNQICRAVKPKVLKKFKRYEKKKKLKAEETTEASTPATDDMDDNVGSTQADVVDHSGGAQLLNGEADTSVFHDLFGTTHDASLRTLIQMRHDAKLASDNDEYRAVDEKMKALRFKIKKIKNSWKRAERLATEPAADASQHEESHTVSVTRVKPPPERTRPGLSGERRRRTGKRTASPPQQEATDAKRPRAHQQMLRTISNTLGNRNEAIKRRMTMIGKLEKELEQNPHGPPWTQKISRKRAADWRREREDRVRKYKDELPEIEKELVEWQKTRIVYKALHAYYRERREEDKFVEKLAEDDCTNPIQILADLWPSESALCIVEAPEAFKNHPEKIAEFKANFASAEAFDTFFQVRHDIRITAKEHADAAKSS